MIDNFGFVRTFACAPKLKVADVKFNKERILSDINTAYHNDANFVLFPELSLTGYTCGDLFQQDILLKSTWNALKEISKCMNCEIVAIIGLPINYQGRLLNVAAVVTRDKIHGLVPKTYLPNYKEYYESRWFKSGISIDDSIDGIPIKSEMLFDVDYNNQKVKFGIEICEDLWVPNQPSTKMALQGATLIFNPSASTETIGKSDFRRNLVEQTSARNIVAYLYAASGPGESTTDVLFSGHCLAAENGYILEESPLYDRTGSMICADFDMERIENDRRKQTTFGDQVNYSELGVFGDNKPKVVSISMPQIEHFIFTRDIDPWPFVPSNVASFNKRATEIFAIQSNSLATRLESCNIKKVVLGISGGLDSTLALLVAVEAFKILNWPMSDIIGITMPGFGTTKKTHNNSNELMSLLKITSLDIDITKACIQHMSDIGLLPEDRSITYENTQARERTQILMDYANKVGAIVIGTGDMSELALGWCTYNGDHMSMYGVNCSIPKTLVRFLVGWVATQPGYNHAQHVLDSICNTTVSPELLPPDEKGEIKQKTEDTVGPYELHDFFLYYHIRWNFTPEKILFLAEKAFKDKYSLDEIQKWLKLFYKRFFTAQFKRDCVPAGPKVGSISLSPRGDWRMPSDASWNTWLN